MKKITPLIIMLLTVCLPSMAQSDLNVYQDELIIKTIPASDVDSVTVTESEPRSIFFWRDGEVFLTFASEEVDSITLSRDGEEPFSYIGIVGFNDDLYVKDIDILSSTTASKYKSFVNSLSKKNGTLLYFAVDNALAMMLNHRFTTPLTSANLITFTDGLDLGSIMKNTNHSSSSAYLSAVSQTIRDAKVQGLPLSAYTVGLRGSDVSDVSLFRKNLRMLASSDDKAFEISSINDLQSKFKDIADEIIRINTRQTISVKIPGTDSGTRSRFVFDGKSAESSQLYIEGSFNLRDFTLRDVTYHGMTARSGSVVQGTLDGIFVTFTLRGLQNESGDGTIPMSNIKHYYRLPSSSSWQINSEFTPSNNTLRSVMHKGTSVMLVLDCSSSLGSDFSRMQSYANSFIDMVANNALLCDVTTPQNVKAEFAMKSGNLVVRLTWDRVRFAESYDVYRSSSSYSSDFSLIASDVTTLYWSDESPLEGISYYKIVAKGHGMTSAMSNAVMARKPFVFNVNGIDINMVKVEGGTFQMG
ncbi:MAG: hypothetical protein J6Z41_07920, partial [Prevotella sp.]|nr:hypothetical protein [Prevotella sp.]